MKDRTIDTYTPTYHSIQRNRDINIYERDVLCSLINHYNINHKSTFSISDTYLSNELGVSRDTIKRSKKRFKSLGFISYTSTKKDINSITEYTLYPEEINKFFNSIIIPVENKSNKNNKTVPDKEEHKVKINIRNGKYQD